MLTAVQGFATRNDMKLDERWVEIAKKESRGKFDIRAKLIRETNEQMLVKPIYTAEDVGAKDGEPEISGVYPYKRGHLATRSLPTECAYSRCKVVASSLPRVCAIRRCHLAARKRNQAARSLSIEIHDETHSRLFLDR